jgi:hypothetical protein
VQIPPLPVTAVSMFQLTQNTTKPMASLIKQVKRMEAPGIGKPSEAWDSIGETQFRL